MKRFLTSLLRILIATLLAVVVLLLLFQNRLIYHPRHYAADALRRDRALSPISYTTSQGIQEAFYLPPMANPSLQPHRLWILFPGNGSLALDWLNFLRSPPDPADGFLLIDYPGYGDCQGAASPGAIQASADAAFAALAGSLHTQPAVLEGNLNLLCHSIGCATGLNFAVRHPVRRIILLAPFTSLRDMARRTVGWPLCWLLLHNYDNRARLADLAARRDPPRIFIFHGEDDQLVPVAMGRQLVTTAPQMISFEAVPGADHNSILLDARDQIFAVMRN